MTSRTPARVRPGYADAVLAHLRVPVGVGRLDAPDGVGVVGSPSCGDVVRVEVALYDGLIEEARFQAFGCPAAIAGGSEVVARVRGRSLLDGARLGAEEVADALELSPAKRRCSNLAADAFHLALEDAVGRGVDLVPAAVALDPRGVLVGMSGGVDSTVAVLRLQREGFRVVGVTFRLWSDPACDSARSCCSPEAVLRARRLAHRLGVPHLTVDLSTSFRERVVDYFVDEYGRALTPNPCVRCNAALRFRALGDLADRLRLGRIASGHYARVVEVGQGATRPALLRGSDRHKDQSYVLAEVAPELLERCLFPLGPLVKSEVRVVAREAGLEVHDAAESQDICFIPDGDYRRFLRERLGEEPGTFVDLAGCTVGRHSGLWSFTIGQRRGIGLAAPEPLYVVALRPESREVVVGPAAAAEVRTVLVRRLVLHQHPVPERVEAQLRSSGSTVGARVTPGDDEVLLELDVPVRGVAPGQTAVLYAGDRVVVAGTIAATDVDVGGLGAAGP